MATVDPIRPDHDPDRDRVELWWAPHDETRLLTGSSVVIALAAPLFAVFGLPHVPLMWPVHQIGLVFPGCGLTRGVVALVRGDVRSALAYNPASLLVALLVSVALARSALGVTTARWLNLRVHLGPRFMAVLSAVVGLLWIRQQANADLLMSR